MSDRKTYQKILAEQSGGKKLGSRPTVYTAYINRQRQRDTERLLMRTIGKKVRDLDITTPSGESSDEDLIQAGAAQNLQQRIQAVGFPVDTTDTAETSGAAENLKRYIKNTSKSKPQSGDDKDSLKDSYIQKRIDSLLERMVSLSEVRIPKHSGRDNATNAGRLDGTVRSRGYQNQMGDSSIPPKQLTQSSTGSTKPPGQMPVNPTTASPNTARDQSKNQQEFGEKLDAELKASKTTKVGKTTEPTGNTELGHDPAYLGLLAAAKKDDGSIEIQNTESAETKAAAAKVAAAKAVAKFASVQDLGSTKPTNK